MEPHIAAHCLYQVMEQYQTQAGQAAVSLRLCPRRPQLCGGTCSSECEHKLFPRRSSTYESRLSDSAATWIMPSFLKGLRLHCCWPAQYHPAQKLLQQELKSGRRQNHNTAVGNGDKKNNKKEKKKERKELASLGSQNCSGLLILNVTSTEASAI